MQPNKQKNPNSRYGMRNAGFIALIVLLLLVVYSAFNQPSTLKTIPITTAIKNANAGDYNKFQISGNEIQITPKGKSKATLKTYEEPNANLKTEGLNYSKVTISANAESSSSSTWLGILETVGPVVAIGVILYIMMKSAQGQGNQALSFGKSRARLYGNEKDKINFTDVAGSDEAKQDLQEVVEFLKYPKKFASVGARIPKGVLLDWSARYG